MPIIDCVPVMRRNNRFIYFVYINNINLCEVSAFGKISDGQSVGPGFNPRHGQSFNIAVRPSSVDSRDVNPLV